MSALKNLLKSLLPESLVHSIRIRRLKSEWIKAGPGVPAPHLLKQEIIKEYGKQSGNRIFVETGTFRGDMVEAQKANFDRLYSIELSHDLYIAASKRFSGDGRITILEGDSGKVLPGLMKELKSDAVFWLDGHYSAGSTAKGEKECPIFEEIDAILSTGNTGHVMLIDDARLFVGKNDYPTLSELEAYVKAKAPSYKMEVEYDVIRFK